MKDKIKEIIAESLDVDVTELQDDTHIANDLDADSVDIITLINDLEDEFDTEVPTDEIRTLETVSDIVSYIEAKKAE